MQKKKMKLWKKILIVALILFAIYVILITRKFIIITKLVNESKEYENKTNYFVTVAYSQKDMIYMNKTYNKDGNLLSEFKFYGKTFDDVVTMITYKNGNEKIGIIQRGEKKEIANEPISGISRIASVYGWFGDRTSEYLKQAITSRITTKSCHGKECYLIETGNLTMWVDKETGLISREINGDFGIREFVYEFDVVNDKDIVKPDIS